MKILYYLKWPFIIFLLGLLLVVIGAGFKLRHWPGADEMLMQALSWKDLLLFMQ
jgi:hypothetical protein